MTIKFLRAFRLILPGAALIAVSISVPLFHSSARAPDPQQCTSDILVIGQKDQTAFAIEIPGLANTTIYWNITQSDAGVLGFSINSAGP